MPTDSCDTKKLIKKELSEEYTPICNDDALLKRNDSDRLIERNVQYTALLRVYVSHTKQLLKKKMLFRKMFFWISVGLLIVFSLLFFIAVFIFGNKGQVESLTVILPATVAYLTTFIVIPQIISKYLFNEQEETNISDIIKSIQEYDKSIRTGLK